MQSNIGWFNLLIFSEMKLTANNSTTSPELCKNKGFLTEQNKTTQTNKQQAFILPWSSDTVCWCCWSAVQWHCTLSPGYRRYTRSSSGRTGAVEGSGPTAWWASWHQQGCRFEWTAGSEDTPAKWKKEDSLQKMPFFICFKSNVSEETPKTMYIKGFIYTHFIIWDENHTYGHFEGLFMFVAYNRLNETKVYICHVFRGMKNVFLHTHRHHLRLLYRKHNDLLL